jgi:hypothetical protein
MLTNTYRFKEGFNPNSPEGADLLVNYVQATFRKIFETIRTIPPHFVMTYAHSPTTGEKQEPEMLVFSGTSADFDSAEGKNRFANMMRQATNASHAFGIAFVSEVWLAAADKDDPGEMERLQNRQGSLANYPGRKEFVMAHIEHAAWGGPAHPRTYLAEIVRDVNGTPTLQEWHMNEGSMQSERFGGLLPDGKGPIPIITAPETLRKMGAPVYEIRDEEEDEPAPMSAEQERILHTIQNYPREVLRALGVKVKAMGIDTLTDALVVWPAEDREPPPLIRISTPNGEVVHKVIRGLGDAPRPEDAEEAAILVV